jgi:hypothetical protein
MTPAKLRKSQKKSFHNQSTKQQMDEIKEFFRERKDAIPFTINVVLSQPHLLADSVWEEIYRYHWRHHSTTKRISPERRNLVKATLRSLGVPLIVLDDEDEADHWCVFSAGRYVDLQDSEDTDVLAMLAIKAYYEHKQRGCRRCFAHIMRVNTTDKTAKIVFPVEILDELERRGYTFRHMVDAFVVCSADYNAKLFHLRIPFLKGLRLVKQHGSAEKVIQILCEQENLPYRRSEVNEIRECYRVPTSYPFRFTDKVVLGTMDECARGRAKILLGFNEARLEKIWKIRSHLQVQTRLYHWLLTITDEKDPEQCRRIFRRIYAERRTLKQKKTVRMPSIKPKIVTRDVTSYSDLSNNAFFLLSEEADD